MANLPRPVVLGCIGEARLPRVPCRRRSLRVPHALSLGSLAALVWLIYPYLYGTNSHMKKTLHIDEKLLAEARAIAQATTDTETVRLGLQALVRHGAYERLRALRGSDPGARDVPRRREKGTRKRRAA